MTSKSKALKKPEPKTSKSKVLKKPEPKTPKSKVLNRPELKTSESKVLKGSQPKEKIDSRNKTFKLRVLNDPKTYYMKDKV